MIKQKTRVQSSTVRAGLGGSPPRGTLHRLGTMLSPADEGGTGITGL